jgi:hypothetical protein
VTEPSFNKRQTAALHSTARIGLAFVFAYHGLVPKLLVHHADEIAMLRDAGISDQRSGLVLILFGVGELLLAFVLLLFWRHRWPALLCLGLMCVGTIGVALSSPRYLVAAFNPVSLNLTIALLALIDVMVLNYASQETHAD